MMPSAYRVPDTNAKRAAVRLAYAMNSWRVHRQRAFTDEHIGGSVDRDQCDRWKS